jgi:thiosulfate/3-mercaptopyruvate sulfurtransferase
MYKGYLVDGNLLGKDPHFAMGCESCHKGNTGGATREEAHQGLVKRPSDNLKTCAMCHKKIAQTYEKTLHYTTAGQRQGVMKRFSETELKQFDEKVFQQSCRSCHASCGSCHVKAAAVGGISIGLIQGHKFVKKDEGKTCAFCHGGRVYPEYTGEYGGKPDVHYQKGMLCMDCHKKEDMHGDGKVYLSKQEVKDRPVCTNCHTKLGQEARLTTRTAHTRHRDKVTCLGLNPRDRKTLTTLRLVPTVRDTFATAGITMSNFDSLPNYWNTPAHNIRKRTDRTRSCDACHADKAGFLKKEALMEQGSQANEGLIYNIKPIPINP